MTANKVQLLADGMTRSNGQENFGGEDVTGGVLGADKVKCKRD